MPLAPALGGFGVERLGAAGADHAAVRGDAPTAKGPAGLLLLGLTQTAPRVNRFVNCSCSPTLSLWVRSPWPERAALCLRRGLVLCCPAAKSPELPVRSLLLLLQKSQLLWKWITVGFGWGQSPGVLGLEHPAQVPVVPSLFVFVCVGDLFLAPASERLAPCSVLSAGLQCLG